MSRQLVSAAWRDYAAAPSMHGLLLDASAHLAPAQGAGALTTIASFSLPSTSGGAASESADLTHARAATLESVSHADGALHVSSTLARAGCAPPVPLGRLLSFRGGSFQGPALAAYAGHASQLLTRSREVAWAGARATALGLTLEAEDDMVRGLYARLKRVLVPDPRDAEAILSSPGDAEAGNAIALACVRSVLDTIESPAEAEELRVQLGLKVARPSAAASPASAVTMTRSSPSEGLSASASTALESKMSPEQLAALRAVRGKRTTRPTASSTTRSNASSSATAQPSTSALPARGAVLGRATPAQLLASLFAVTHGYASCVHLRKLATFEQRLWSALAAVAAPPRTPAGSAAWPVFDVDVHALSQRSTGDSADSLLSAALRHAAPPLAASSAAESGDPEAVVTLSRSVRSARPGERIVPVAVAGAAWEALPPVWRMMHRVTAAVTEAVINEP